MGTQQYGQRRASQSRFAAGNLGHLGLGAEVFGGEWRLTADAVLQCRINTRLGAAPALSRSGQPQGVAPTHRIEFVGAGPRACPIPRPPLGWTTLDPD